MITFKGRSLLNWWTDGWATALTMLRLRLRGASFGCKLRCLGRAVAIRGAGRFEMGERVSFRGMEGRVHLTAEEGATIRIGSGCFFNSGALVHATAQIQFGEGCLIGHRCYVGDSNFHPVHEDRRVRSAEIRLGDNVWLAAGVVVLPGVVIGAHSVIAAGSVVTGHVPPRQVWRGNPAIYERDVRGSDAFRRTSPPAGVA